MIEQQGPSRAGALPEGDVRSWDDYYDFRLNWYKHARNVFNHLPFMRTVRRLQPQRLVEVGSGSGSMSIFFSYLFPYVVSVDLSVEIVRRCKDANRRLKGRAHFAQGDAFHLDRFADHEFDVAFSQGFFEHFSDEEIARLLREQARLARHVVFSVPNDRYPRRDYGNERLLRKEWWDETIGRAGLRLLESRDYAKFLRPRRDMYLAVLTASRED